MQPQKVAAAPVVQIVAAAEQQQGGEAKVAVPAPVVQQVPLPKTGPAPENPVTNAFAMAAQSQKMAGKAQPEGIESYENEVMRGNAPPMQFKEAVSQPVPEADVAANKATVVQVMPVAARKAAQALAEREEQAAAMQPANFFLSAPPTKKPINLGQSLH